MNRGLLKDHDLSHQPGEVCASRPQKANVAVAMRLSPEASRFVRASDRLRSSTSRRQPAAFPPSGCNSPRQPAAKPMGPRCSKPSTKRSKTR